MPAVDRRIDGAVAADRRNHLLSVRQAEPMASEVGKHLEPAIVELLRAHGFKKSGTTWRRPSSEAVAVLNLQASAWGRFAYVNLGVYFRALGTLVRPSESVCHLRCRLAQLVPDAARLTQILDLESPLSDSSRLGELAELVSRHAIPWLDRVSTRDGARLWCISPSSPACFVSAQARPMLELPPGA